MQWKLSEGSLGRHSYRQIRVSAAHGLCVAAYRSPASTRCSVAACDALLLLDIDRAACTIRTGLMAAGGLVRASALSQVLTGSTRSAQRADVIERGAEPVSLGFQVVAGLQVQPEPLRGTE